MPQGDKGSYASKQKRKAAPFDSVALILTFSLREKELSLFQVEGWVEGRFS